MNELWSIPPSDFLTLMDQKDRAALLAITEKQSFARNDFVFQAGSPGENVYILVSGRIKQFLASSPATAMLVIDLLSCRLRTLGEMLLNLTSDDVTSRVIKLLTRLSARYGKPMNRFTRLDIALTHQEMADMIGTSRQTVTSVLGELRRKGLLRIENHRMHISNDELLERFENSPYAATGN
jgi:CRP-like cAMP-binding protein